MSTIHRETDVDFEYHKDQLLLINDMIGTLMIYHRCNFWGREIHGRRTERQRGIHERVLHTQVVLKNHHGFFGCCFSHGRRVSELKEHHFLAHFDGTWNLFLMERKVSTSSGAYHMIFVFLPENVPPNPRWKHEGTIRPRTARMDLERHFYPILMTNTPYGYPRNHVHLIIVMDTAICPHMSDWENCPQPSFCCTLQRTSVGTRVEGTEENELPDMFE